LAIAWHKRIIFVRLRVPQVTIVTPLHVPPQAGPASRP